MGKRKERRLAALSNAGRRVKLDLFAEPCGDLGGSSVHDEVGGETDSTQRSTGLPNSPSSSGQPPQNPLLLLGQYSDDELDEESSKMPKHAIAEGPLVDHNQEAQICEGKDVDVNEVEDPVAQKVKLSGAERESTLGDVSLISEGGGTGENDATASADASKEMELAEQHSVTGTSNAHVIGDASFGWRMVLHEESNQYYYWNTETGETSWEVPDVLVQMTNLSSDQIIPATESGEIAPVHTYDSRLGVELDTSSAGLNADGLVGATLIPESKEMQTKEQNMDELVEGYKTEALKDKNWESDVHQDESENNLSATTAFLDNGSLAVSENIHDAEINDDHLGGMDLAAKLMKQCECLLERTRSLKGYASHQEHNQMWKYILEVEIRLSDIKSLSSYGSSLLPFWAHSERQLNQLEDAINHEIYQLAVSAQMDDDVQKKATADVSFKEKEISEESMKHEFEDNAYPSSRKSEISPISTGVENGLQKEAALGNVSSFASPARDVEGDAAVMEEANESSYLKPEIHAVEDVDMDVDMEVEDPGADIATSGDVSSGKDFAPADKLIQPNPHAEYPSLASGDALTVPLPPEEEWIPPPPPDNEPIPPPPPDNEQVPPPPPDEPSESSYPSYPEMGQPLPYTEQFNLAYPDSNYPYYGAAVTVPSSNLYGHADVSQVAMSHAPVYYETVSNTYVDTAPVMVGPVQPVAYYNLQDGSVPPVPVVNGVESSLLSPESDNLTFTQSTVINDPSEAGSNVKLDVSSVSTEPDLASVVVPSSFTTIQISANDLKETVSTSSNDTATGTAAVLGPSTTTKVQSKVLRTKKRTVAVAPSLRSNKKVSSLVDKWKAAKEELNENEEDEPDNAYEILERKRQREIEEWHAKQIASGEAKDNANFQPLGGDWRERVKRRRAQAAKEAKQAALTPTEARNNENKKPDLVELSSGLPSGWQAYWDESSKEVYYGNTITSETTWTRPTK